MKRGFLGLLKSQPRHELGVSEEDGVRYLHFGSVWIQGGMLLRDPYHLQLDYTRQLFAGLLFQPEPKRIALLGLGAASATKFAWKQFPRARITTVELNPAVIQFARQNFHLPPDSTRMNTIAADAAEWVAAHPQSTNYLVVDVYDAAARGPALSSVEFYTDCRNALMTDRLSVMAVNLFGKDRSFKVNIENIDRAFDGRVLTLPATERGNLIVFGLAGPEAAFAWGELRARASVLRETTGLEFASWISGFRKMNRSDAAGLPV